MGGEVGGGTFCILSTNVAWKCMYFHVGDLDDQHALF